MIYYSYLSVLQWSELYNFSCNFYLRFLSIDDLNVVEDKTEDC